MSPLDLREQQLSGLRGPDGVGWLLRRAAITWPDHDAIVVQDRRLTFRELDQWVETAAARLVAAGIGAGDAVVSQMVNRVESVVLQHALWRVGAVSVPVLPMFGAAELSHVVRQVRVRGMVTQAEASGGRDLAADLDEVSARVGAPTALRWLTGEGARPGWESFPAPVGAPAQRVTAAPAPADEVCLVLFTSGTTSEPKGVRHNSRSLVAEAGTYRDSAGLHAASALLVPGPLSHVGSAVSATITPCLTGAKAVVLPRWEAVEAVEMCDREGVTFSVAVPLFLREMLDLWESSHDSARRPAAMAIGGAAAPPDLIERSERLGIFTWRGWGMTEAPSLTTAFPDDPIELRAGTDGRLDHGTEVQAVDGSRNPVAADVDGELRVRSPKQMVGYLRPEYEAESVDAEGWFYTGDVGRVSADGWVTITGRLKDVVNRGGEKFSAAEIENAILRSDDAIAAVAVLGVPDERFGEAVAAFVTLKPGRAWTGEGALVSALRDAGLARPKIPVHWTRVERLPVTATGKTRKHELLERWVAGGRTVEQ